MKVYGDLHVIEDVPRNCYEFEVLNELKDCSNRSDANCLYHTRFVFECDNTPIDEQEDRAYSLRADEMAVRATHSGGKSIHIIIEFEHALEPICKQYYKEIWKSINQLLFNNEADKACANPARLTRRPNAIRQGGKVQKLLYEMPENVIEQSSEVWKRIWRGARAQIATKAVIAENTSKVDSNTTHDKMCLTYDKIQHYLRTPYTKMTGNGDSDSSLFKAIVCCLKYKDSFTLNVVLNKARSERWSEKELQQKIRNAEQLLLR